MIPEARRRHMSPILARPIKKIYGVLALDTVLCAHIMLLLCDGIMCIYDPIGIFADGSRACWRVKGAPEVHRHKIFLWLAGYLFG